jgi:hypothetical protein
MASPAERTLNQSSLYTATRPASEYQPLSSIHSFSGTCMEVFSAEDLAKADGAPLNAMLCEWPLCAKSCLSEWPHSATAPAVGNQAYG